MQLIQGVLLLCCVIHCLSLATNPGESQPGQMPLQPKKFGKQLNMAVVRPFIEKDVKLMLDNMQHHRDIWQAGCRKKEDMTEKLDLVFYFNRELAVHSEIVESLNSIIHDNATSCFHEVKFVSARLTDEEDGYPRGCCNQFFKLFTNRDLRSEIGNYDAIFLMEPDVYPLRNQWLEKLVEEAQWMQTSGLWVSGPEYDTRDVPSDYRFLPWYSDNHLNGNSIYVFDDTGYSNFLADAFQYATNHCFYGDYDEKIWQYVLNSQNPGMKSRFHTSDLVGHCKTNAGWDPHLTLEQAKNRYPSAYMIHAQPLLD